MLFGLDASRATVARRTGTENYALRLIQNLLALETPHHFRLYFRDAPAPGLFPRGEQRLIPFPRLWTHLRLATELFAARPRPEALFVPAHALPFICPVPAVVTVHDLGYKHFPEAHPPAQRFYLDGSTRFSARAAAHVIADSEATRRDLIRFYALPPEKITVVYPGRDASFAPASPEAIAAAREKYSLPPHYLLHVGTLHPRKNLIRLMDAVSLISNSLSPSLLLLGRPGWLSAPIVAKAHESGARILDNVPDTDLPALYSGATAFVFPSLFEGFGFPVLEAMACGVPVVCANTSSLPEVAGDAALLVKPTDTRELAAALERLLSDAALRATLIERGFQQVKKFSWEKAARETLEILEKAGRKGNGRL